MSVPPEAAPRERSSPAFGVAIALAAAIVVAGGLIAVLGPSKPGQSLGLWRSGRGTSTTAHAPLVAPRLEPLPEVEPEGVVGVPPEVLRTSTVVAASWAPGLALIRTAIKPGWEQRRAEIEDRTNGDVRAYAIGDLLPHGSLLVGISTGTADIMVGDSQLVRLFEGGRIASLEDFTLAFEPQALKPVKPGLGDDFRDRVLLALHDAGSEDPAVVQAAIDDLIACGDPGIELLMPYVDSGLALHGDSYKFPSRGTRRMRPQALGELVMIVLEQITGQTFGHIKEGLTVDERAAIARSWRRWWGAE